MSDAPSVSVRARFERFPATVKGAFLIRGEDADPHLVVLHEARVASIGAGSGRPVDLGEVVLDVAPHRDVFVPFEFAVSDLPPGWYGLECDLEVDGVSGTYPGGKRFVVPWPRAAVRRGTVRVDRSAPVGHGKVRIEQVECVGDSIKLHLVAEPPVLPPVRLSADGDTVALLDEEFDEETGRGRVTAYPLLRSQEVLRIEVGRGSDRQAIDIRLD